MRLTEIWLFTVIHNQSKIFSHYLNKNFLEAQLIKNLIFFIWCILSDRKKRLWRILTRGRGEPPSLITQVRKRLWSYVIYSDKLKIVQIWLKNYFSIRELSKLCLFTKISFMKNTFCSIYLIFFGFGNEFWAYVRLWWSMTPQGRDGIFTTLHRNNLLSPAKHNSFNFIAYLINVGLKDLDANWR